MMYLKGTAQISRADFDMWSPTIDIALDVSDLDCSLDYTETDGKSVEISILFGGNFHESDRFSDFKQHLQELDEITSMLCADQALAISDRDWNVEFLQQRNWVLESLKTLPALSVGRFHIFGSHCKPTKSQWDILIDAGEAFGSGHHETTYGCLKLFDHLLRSQAFSPKNPVLDIGCGSGILAMAAALSGSRHVSSFDIDPVAVAVASGNIRANGLTPKISVVCADGPDSLRHPDGGYDLVFANLTRDVLRSMIAPIDRCLAHGGYLIMSGILVRQMRQVLARCTARRWRLVKVDQRDEWVSILLHKPNVATSDDV